MVRSTTRSLAARAGAVARRVTGKKAASGTATPATAKKAAAKKAAPVKKAAAKKAAPVKKAAPAKKATAKKAAPATKAAAKQAAPATKVAAKKAAPVTKAAAKKVSPAKKAAATKAAPTPAPKAAPAAKKPAARRSRATLVVLAHEKPWTKAELDEVRAHLNADIQRLVPELEVADEDLHRLMIDSGDGAGHDQADVGSSTFERDQEMVIANNARDMLTQSRHALERIADGTYGVCEGCGEPIGKMRLLAFPRATLCLTCKQREERR